MPKLVRVCRDDELREGMSLVVTTDADQILVLKHGGNIYAVSNICTHEYAELVNGLIVDGTITCPVHLSRFRLDTGEVLNPPAVKTLKTYKIVVERGDVLVEV